LLWGSFIVNIDMVLQEDGGIPGSEHYLRGFGIWESRGAEVVDQTLKLIGIISLLSGQRDEKEKLELPFV
jgi:hypothetical protein